MNVILKYFITLVLYKPIIVLYILLFCVLMLRYLVYITIYSMHIGLYQQYLHCNLICPANLIIKSPDTLQLKFAFICSLSINKHYLYYYYKNCNALLTYYINRIYKKILQLYLYYIFT